MSKKVGPYTIRLLETGEFALDGGAMFGVVPKTLWEKTNPPDSTNRIDMALRVMLIQGSGKNILVDTGIGDKWDDKYKAIYRISHERYSLENALKSVGLKYSDITDIIISHLHFDHCGGCTYKEKDQLKLTFPSATHTVQKEQWAWANKPIEKDRASFLKENLEPLKQAKLKLLDGEAEIYPGIRVLISHGHTRSQQVVKVTDGKQTLFYCADLIPTSSHIPIPYIMSYDNFPLIIMEEKKNILEQAVKENWILCFEHDPKVPAATVAKDPAKGRFSLKEVISF
ncbi:MAG: MBL fold metallo-hydrolase [Deltaproteobacteria bacterium]|nr:MBL fold metallo-hydrolase [Deltaproteobacteria bacterium]MBI3016845.1 MBL fold metallo-hydrolase [Deltaproteobacteria bacterium]